MVSPSWGLKVGLSRFNSDGCVGAGILGPLSLADSDRWGSGTSKWSQASERLSLCSPILACACPCFWSFAFCASFILSGRGGQEKHVNMPLPSFSRAIQA